MGCRFLAAAVGAVCERAARNGPCRGCAAGADRQGRAAASARLELARRLRRGPGDDMARLAGPATALARRLAARRADRLSAIARCARSGGWRCSGLSARCCSAWRMAVAGSSPTMPSSSPSPNGRNARRRGSCAGIIPPPSTATAAARGERLSRLQRRALFARHAGAGGRSGGAGLLAARRRVAPWARLYLWAHIAAGWGLTLLAVAGFSGLVQTRATED